MSFFKKPFVLDVELTSVCNAECVMCPRDSLTRPMGFMPQRIFDQLVHKIKETEVTHVIFSGFGEAGLHKKFVDHVDALIKETNCYTQLNSNGIVLTKKLVDELAETGLKTINLNINAINDEEYAKILPGKGRFDKVLANVRYIVEKKRQGWDLKLKIQTTVLEQYSAEMNAFRDFWFAQGIDEIVAHPCNNRGGHYKGNEFVKGEPVDKATAYCSFMLFVAWNGDIFSCSHDLAGDYKIGNIQFLEKSWTDKARIPLCETCNISSFKVLERASA
jgi:MoaA/NifB/PqqE/SkfB family radical SAM enzyme